MKAILAKLALGALLLLILVAAAASCGKGKGEVTQANARASSHESVTGEVGSRGKPSLVAIFMASLTFACFASLDKSSIGER
jgi:hypothetical protein